jgi:hypothetical protein
MNTRRIRLALVAAACLAGAVHAQTVTPPPLPIGSLQVRPEPGMSEPERKRAVRAHHHKMHNKRDYTRDDSVQGPEGGAVQPVGTGAAGAGAAAMGGGPGMAVQGGAGTGAKRDTTDKGASSFFFGNDKQQKK